MTDLSHRRSHRAVTVVPVQVTERFGSPDALPRIVQVYDPRRGWIADHGKEVLTTELVGYLKTSGFTQVEARWRRKVVRVNLLAVSSS